MRRINVCGDTLPPHGKQNNEQSANRICRAASGQRFNPARLQQLHVPTCMISTFAADVYTRQQASCSLPTCMVLYIPSQNKPQQGRTFTCITTLRLCNFCHASMLYSRDPARWQCTVGGCTKSPERKKSKMENVTLRNRTRSRPTFGSEKAALSENSKPVNGPLTSFIML